METGKGREQELANGSWVSREKVKEETIQEAFNVESHFKNEKEMCDYIEENIHQFCSDVLDDEYKCHEREFQVCRRRGKFSKDVPNIRIDFVIWCKTKAYAIEVKNPKQKYTEMSRSIGQMMMYDMVLTECGLNYELCMVSSQHSPIYSKMLLYYGLKYRYILFNKISNGELIGYEND